MADIEPKDDGPRLGIFDDISNDEYHRGPGISKSGLDLIDQSPAHYRVYKQHPKPPTPAMFIGTAFHKLVLEPDTFDQDYVLEPADAPRRPTAAQLAAKAPSAAAMKSIAFWEEWDERNADKLTISDKPGDNPFWKPGDWTRLHLMRDALAEHPVASILLDLSQGKAEQSCFWLDGQVNRLCKCRPDFLNEGHNLCVDLKTTEDASYTAFSKSAAKFNYHRQDPFYRAGLRSAGRPVGEFVFVAVEKQPPYGVGCYVLDPEAKRIGRTQVRRLLEIYSECKRNDEWPSYPPEPRDLQLPRWAAYGNVS